MQKRYFLLWRGAGGPGRLWTPDIGLRVVHTNHLDKGISPWPSDQRALELTGPSTATSRPPFSRLCPPASPWVLRGSGRQPQNVARCSGPGACRVLCTKNMRQLCPGSGEALLNIRQQQGTWTHAERNQRSPTCKIMPCHNEHTTGRASKPGLPT